ncbi:hypothetical protein PENTCL1PPCAC_23242, partial [Pristionchus entomophagus]
SFLLSGTSDSNSRLVGSISSSPPPSPLLLYPNMLRSFSRSDSACISRRDSSMSSSSLPSPSEPPDTSATFVAVLVNLCVDRVENLPLEVADLHLVARVSGETRSLYTSQKLEGEEDEINDKVSLIVDDIGRSLTFEVIGKNKWRKDNVIDRGTIELVQCRLFKWQELSLVMEHVAIACSIQVHPITSSQKEEFCKRWGSAGVRVEHGRSVGRANTAECSIINIVLIKGFNIGDPLDPPDAAVKFKLGTEKYKSKVISKSSEPEWGESFEMKLPKGIEVMEMQIVCRRKKNLISTGELHLSGLPRDKAIRQEVILGPKSSLDIIVSVPAGLTNSSVLANVAPAYDNRFSLRNTFSAISEVGELVVKIIRADNVEAMDLGGKSDPFAILRMGNLRVRTHTHYATLFPEWNRLFVLPVEDIHAVIDVSLFDEDSTGKADFLGRVSVPLLQINGWERRWFPLKDRKLLKPAKGRVLLEMRLQYNMIRAVIRTFTPREKEYLMVTPKFKPSVLKASVNEIRRFGSSFTPVFQSIDDVMRWKKPSASFLSMIIFVFVILYMEVFHLPMFLVALILNSCWNSFVTTKEGPVTPPPTPKETDSNSSILSISDTLLELQETLAFITLLIQRFRNASDMTSPWLTSLAIFVLSAATVLLYLVPLRYLVLAWGINKFTKRLRKPPNFVDNNELLDFLSRVPSDRQLKEWDELTPTESFTTQPKKSVDSKL